MPKSLSHFSRVSPVVNATKRTITIEVPIEAGQLIGMTRNTRDLYWTVTDGVLQVSSEKPRAALPPLFLGEDAFVPQRSR